LFACVIFVVWWVAVNKKMMSWFPPWSVLLLPLAGVQCQLVIFISAALEFILFAGVQCQLAALLPLAGLSY